MGDERRTNLRPARTIRKSTRPQPRLTRLDRATTPTNAPRTMPPRNTGGRAPGPAAREVIGPLRLLEQLDNPLNELSAAWFGENSGPQGSAETAQRASTLHQHLITQTSLHIRGEDFNLDASGTAAGQPVSKRMADRLARFVVDHAHPIVVNTLRLFEDGPSQHTKIFIVERSARLRPGERRHPYAHKEITDTLSTALDDMHVHATLRKRLSARAKTKGTWAYQLNRDGRALLLAIPMHIINWCAYLARLLDSQTEDDKNVLDALDDMDIIADVQTGAIRHRVEVNHDTAHEDTLVPLWDNITSQVLELGARLSHHIVLHAPESQYTLVKPEVGSANIALNMDALVSAQTIFDALTDVNDFSALLFSIVFEALCTMAIARGALTPTEAWGDNMDRVLQHSMQLFYRRFLSAVAYSLPGDPVANIARITDLPDEWVCRAFHEFQARRAALLVDNNANTMTQEERADARVQDAQPVALVSEPPAPPRNSQPAQPPHVTLKLIAPVPPVVPATQVDDTVQAVAAENVHVCYSCEQVWPKNIPWPPPTSRVNRGKRIIITDDEVEAPATTVAGSTRAQARAATDPDAHVAMEAPNAAPDLLDMTQAAEGRTDAQRLATINTIMDTLLTNTADMENIRDVLAARINQSRDAAAAQAAAAEAEAAEQRRRAAIRQLDMAEATARRMLEQVEEEQRQLAAAERRRAREAEAVAAARVEAERARQAVPPLENGAVPTNAYEENVLSGRDPRTPHATVTATTQYGRGQIPRVPRLPPPDPQPDAEDVVRPGIHVNIPTEWNGYALDQVRSFLQLVQHWATLRTTEVRLFDEGRTTTHEAFIQLFNMPIAEGTNYVTDMPIVYDSMQDYVRMRKAIIMTQMFNALSDVARSPRTWEQRDIPADLYNYTRRTDTYTPRLTTYTVGLRPILAADDGRLPFTTVRFEVEYANGAAPQLLRRHDVVLWREYQITGPHSSRHSQTYLTVVVDRRHEHGQNGAPDVYRYDNVLLGFATGDTTDVPRRTLRERAVQLTVAQPEVLTYFGQYARQLDALQVLQNAPESMFACLAMNRTVPLDVPEDTATIGERLPTGFFNVGLRPRRRNADTYDLLMARFEAVLGNEFVDVMRHYCDLFLSGNGNRMSPEARDNNSSPINVYQALAVGMALDVGGIRGNTFRRGNCTAIIGPPGTGKTRCIFHILSALPVLYPNAYDALMRMTEVRNQWIDTDVLERDDIEATMSRIGNPDAAREHNEAEHNTTRVLVLAPSHQAIDVIERSLLETQLQVSRRGNRAIQHVVPYYRRLGLDVRTDPNENLDELRARMLPEIITENYSHFITLSTFGSLHRAFPNNYRYIIMDECSMVSDEDMNTLYAQVLTHYAANNYPKLIFAGDPLQLPSTYIGPPSVFKIIQQCSPLERFAPEAVPHLSGQNSIATVMLNIQYRMHTEINRLGNHLSQRNVISAPLHNEQGLFNYVNNYIEEYATLQNFDFTSPVCWFDPFHSRDTLEDDPNYRRLQPINVLPNQSSHEATFILRLVQLMVMQGGIPTTDIMILTTYNNQRELIVEAFQRFLPVMIPARHDDEELILPLVCTVASSQGSEAGTVIYSSGRMPGDREISQDSLLQSLRQLYVCCTRAINRLYLLGPRDNLNQCRSWNSLFAFLDQGTAPPSP